MNGTEQAIVEFISKNGNEVEYVALYDALGFEHRQGLPRALDVLKANGKIYRHIDAQSGTPRHVVGIVASEQEGSN